MNDADALIYDTGTTHVESFFNRARVNCPKGINFTTMMAPLLQLGVLEQNEGTGMTIKATVLQEVGFDVTVKEFTQYKSTYKSETLSKKGSTLKKKHEQKKIEKKRKVIAKENSAKKTISRKKQRSAEYNEIPFETLKAQIQEAIQIEWGVPTEKAKEFIRKSGAKLPKNEADGMMTVKALLLNGLCTCENRKECVCGGAAHGKCSKVQKRSSEKNGDEKKTTKKKTDKKQTPMVGIQTMNHKRLGSKMLLVFFDFETTGFQYSDEIWQMGACYGVWDKKCIHNIRDTFAENITLVKKKLSKFCLNNCCDFDGSKITHDKVSEGIGFCNAIKKWQKQILEIKKKKKIKECMLVIIFFRLIADNLHQTVYKETLILKDFLPQQDVLGFLTP